MPNTLTITNVTANPSGLFITFKVKLTGSYVQVGSGTTGELLDFQTATLDPEFLGMGVTVPASLQTPIALTLNSTTGQITYQYVPVVTSVANVKIKVLSALGTELSAGAYPAAVTGDTIEGSFTLQKNI